jgi:GST-like protein
MIDVYGMSSPNVVKITVMLEETGLPYRQHHVNVFAGEQHAPEFLSISPNNKVPVIVDEDGPDGLRCRCSKESGAILLYLAEKTGKLLPAAAARAPRSSSGSWCRSPRSDRCSGNWCTSPATPSGNDYSVQRYTSEVRRIFAVLEKRLAPARGCGADYSVADVATWPWIRTVCGSIRSSPPRLQRAMPSASGPQ